MFMTDADLLGMTPAPPAATDARCAYCGGTDPKCIACGTPLGTGEPRA